MKHLRKSEFSNEELDIVDKFEELARTGTPPDIEEFLAPWPGYADRLRPVLEGAALVGRAAAGFRKHHPDVNLHDALRSVESKEDTEAG